MVRLPYNGTWVTCGSYAFLNGTGLPLDDLIPVENSTGTPWGMSSLEDGYEYTRILTPFREFSSGIDEAARLWGVELRHTEYPSSGELDPEAFPEEAAVIVGPINMENLSYFPLSRQYKLADHFILVRRKEATHQFLITDSEGIAGCYLDFKALKAMLSIQNIPEAKGALHLRWIIGVHEPASRAEIAAYTAKKAMQNLRDAENAGQGYNAFLRCCDLVRQTETVLFKSSLNYNLVYLIQRRLMVERFLDGLKESNRFFADRRLYEDLYLQMEQAASCRAALMTEHIDEVCGNLEKLSDSEKEYTYHWEGVIKNGWY